MMLSDKTIERKLKTFLAKSNLKGRGKEEGKVMG